MSEPVRPIWTRRVRAAVAVKGPARAVLYALADRADEDGIAWPGQAQLALDSGVSDRTVREALKVLQATGYIECAGSKFGADVWRVTVDEAGNATGDRNWAPVRNGAPAEAGSARTGTGLRKDRKRAPLAPEAGSDKEPMKVPLKDPGKGERAPAPEQPKATNAEPKPRTKVTGSSQMPTSEIADADKAARIRESIRDRIAHHAGSCPIALTEWKPLHNLAAASGYDEAVALRAIDWLYTASDDLRWGGNEASYTVGRGVRGALDNRSHRLVEASAVWERMGRPTRAATKPTDDRPATSATPVWDSMREAIERLPYRSILGERTQAGVMLHPEPAEHARRALAFRRAGDRDGYLSTLETFGDAARAAAVARFAASFERHYAELAAVEAA